jgi:hypothetical protein
MLLEYLTEADLAILLPVAMVGAAIGIGVGALKFISLALDLFERLRGPRSPRRNQC